MAANNGTYEPRPGVTESNNGKAESTMDFNPGADQSSTRAQTWQQVAADTWSGPGDTGVRIPKRVMEMTQLAPLDINELMDSPGSKPSESSKPSDIADITKPGKSSEEAPVKIEVEGKSIPADQDATESNKNAPTKMEGNSDGLESSPAEMVAIAALAYGGYKLIKEGGKYFLEQKPDQKSDSNSERSPEAEAESKPKRVEATREQLTELLDKAILEKEKAVEDLKKLEGDHSEALKKVETELTDLKSSSERLKQEMTRQIEEKDQRLETERENFKTAETQAKKTIEELKADLEAARTQREADLRTASSDQKQAAEQIEKLKESLTASEEARHTESKTAEEAGQKSARQQLCDGRLGGRDRAGERRQSAGQIGAGAGVEFVGLGGGGDGEGADGAGGAFQRMGELGAPAGFRHRSHGQALDDLAGLAVEQAQQLGFEIALAKGLAGEMHEVNRAIVECGDRQFGDGIVRLDARKIGHFTLHKPSIRKRRGAMPAIVRRKD